GEGGRRGRARPGTAPRRGDRTEPAWGLGSTLLRRRLDGGRRVLPARRAACPTGGLRTPGPAPHRLPRRWRPLDLESYAPLQPERRGVYRDPGLHARERTRLAGGDAFFGEGTLDAHAWVGPVLQALREQARPAHDALGKLRARSSKQKRELQNAKDYFATNRDRMRYPEFLAQNLPIGSGVVEATCRSLVCQRTKDAGMRWTRLGAQAVLNLRCLHLSHPDRWRGFFARHPLRRTPRLAHSGGHQPRLPSTGTCYHHKSAPHPDGSSPRPTESC
ncbi:hypothetical protein B1A_15441, partial [mine drainage metagenome]